MATSSGGSPPGRFRGDERGDIIGSWLLQLVVFLAVLSFVAYEAISVFVTTVGVEDAAREVARVARDEYRTSGSLERAMSSAEASAGLRDARVTAVAVDGDELVVDLERHAPTLVIHRVGPFEDLVTANTSSRISWTS